jgi:hypothetical protein
MPSLILGPVSFADFELPEAILFGGRQRLAVHQLPGGQRVIDAMGRDDAPLTWSGIFAGPTATARARTLDLLRAQGAPVQAMWDDFAYTVVVSRFDARYERATWVPYQIACTVIADDTFVLAQTATNLLGSLLGDLGAATGLAPLDLSAATTAVSAAGAMTAGSTANAYAASALAGAAGAASQALASSGAALLGSGSFASLAAAAQQSAQLAAAQGFLQRAAANLANAGT